MEVEIFEALDFLYCTEDGRPTVLIAKQHAWVAATDLDDLTCNAFLYDIYPVRSFLLRKVGRISNIKIKKWY